jgi:hypothetical protein
MKKTILSGASFLFLPIMYLCLEVGCLVLCYFHEWAYLLLIIISIGLVTTLILSSRIVTIVTYDSEKETVSRRGLFGGFYREIMVSDMIRAEIVMIPKEQEYILLIDNNQDQHFDSWLPSMPIRVPNNAKGREFVAAFYPQPLIQTSHP